MAMHMVNAAFYNLALYSFVLLSSILMDKWTMHFFLCYKITA